MIRIFHASCPPLFKQWALPHPHPLFSKTTYSVPLRPHLSPRSLANTHTDPNGVEYYRSHLCLIPCAAFPYWFLWLKLAGGWGVTWQEKQTLLTWATTLFCLHRFLKDKGSQLMKSKCWQTRLQQSPACWVLLVWFRNSTLDNALEMKSSVWSEGTFFSRFHPCKYLNITVLTFFCAASH